MKKRKLSDFLSREHTEGGKRSGGFAYLRGGTALPGEVPVLNTKCINDFYCNSSNLDCTNTWNCEWTGNSKGCSNAMTCIS